MTELEPGAIPLVARLCTGDFQIDDRMMLTAHVMRDGQSVYERTALNEVMISKKSPIPYHSG